MGQNNKKLQPKARIVIPLSARLSKLIGFNIKESEIRVARRREKIKALPQNTRLLISIDRTLRHSDKLTGANILLFTFLSSELIFLTIGDAFGYLKNGLIITHFLGYALPFVVNISSINFPFFALILSAILSIPGSWLIWEWTKPNN